MLDFWSSKVNKQLIHETLWHVSAMSFGFQTFMSEAKTFTDSPDFIDGDDKRHTLPLCPINITYSRWKPFILADQWSLPSNSPIVSAYWAFKYSQCFPQACSLQILQIKSSYTSTGPSSVMNSTAQSHNLVPATVDGKSALCKLQSQKVVSLSQA